jgi:hypothetical protein
MNEKVFVGPKFGTLINRKGLQFSELLQLSSASNDAIRALSIARAAAVEEERKSDKQQKMSVEEKPRLDMEHTFGSFRNL